MRVPEMVVSAVASALAGVGLLVDDLAPVERETGRTVLTSVSAGLAARVEHEDASPDEVGAQLSRVARIVDAGARLLSPLLPDPLVLPDGRAVSVWPLAVETDAAPAEMATVLRSLHDSAVGDLAAWALPDELRGRCHALRQAPRGSDIARVADWIDDLDRRRPPRGREVPVHGDAHRENVMRYRGHAVLIDLDGIARGPREYDLAAWAVSQRRDRHEQDLTALVRAYGSDLVDPDVLAWCVDVSEANVVSWLVTDGRATAGAEQQFHALLASERPTSLWWNHAAGAPGSTDS